MTTEIIVPQSALHDAKGRLAGRVGRQQRLRLAHELLIRTLTVARNVAPIAVVSPSPALAEITRALGGRFILQRSVGLNGGLSEGRDDARARGVGTVAVVHADLPLLRAADIQDLLESAEQHRIAIAPDKTGSGTNALAFATGTAFSFHFGQDSFAAHRREALDRGLQLSVVRRQGLSLDLDTPADLDALLATDNSAWMRSVVQVGVTSDDLGSLFSGVS